MGQVGVAVIGSGYWGINYVRMFNELPQSKTMVVCDQRADRLEEVGRRFPGVALTVDLEDAVSRDEVKAVVISTPATTHYRVALQCLKAGKHLLVEKPLTTNSEEAEELITQAESRGLTLMVGHTFVHNRAIQKLKYYVDQAGMGQLYYLYARRTNMGPIRHDVNALWDLASHDVSIFNFLLGGTPDWASAVGARVLRNTREDVGFISLGYPGDIIGHIHVSWADPNKVREIVVVGSDRRIVFDDLNALERIRVFEKGVKASPEASSYGEHQIQMRDGDIISPKVEVTEPLKEQCTHFLHCVVEGATPVTDGREGLAVVQVMEAADRSLQLGGAPVAVRQPDETHTRLAAQGSIPTPALRTMMESAHRSANRLGK